MASLIAMAKENGWQDPEASKEHMVTNVDDDTIERLIHEMENGVGMPDNSSVLDQPKKKKKTPKLHSN